MTDDLSPKQAARKEREERLAAELRENLKRRKAQARARRGSDAPRDGQDQAKGGEGGGTAPSLRHPGGSFKR